MISQIHIAFQDKFGKTAEADLSMVYGLVRHRVGPVVWDHIAKQINVILLSYEF